MQTKYFKFAEQIGMVQNALSNLFRSLLMTTYAEENEDSSNKSGGGSKEPLNINYEQLIAAARKEEKDKLYPRIQEAERKAASTIDSLNTALLESGKLKTRVNDLEGEIETLKQANNAEEDVEKNQVVIDLRKEVNDLKEKIVEFEAKEDKDPIVLEEEAKEAFKSEIRTQIEAEYEVKLYREQQINANKDSILEVFIEGVTGTTNEEVNTSIEDAIEKTKKTRVALGLSEEGEIDSKVSKKEEKPPVANPAQSNFNGVDLDDFRNLDPRSKEYIEMREKLGLK